MRNGNREGRNLLRLRKAKGLTQQELADLVGVGKAYISSLETGRIGLSKAKSKELAQVLDVDIQEFYQTEKPQESEPLRFIKSEIDKRFADLSESDQLNLVAKIATALANSRKK